MVRHTSVIGWIYVPRSSTVDYGTLAGRLVALSLACGQPTMAHCGPPPHPPPTNPLLSSRGVQLYWASLVALMAGCLLLLQVAESQFAEWLLPSGCPLPSV